MSKSVRESMFAPYKYLAVFYLGGLMGKIQDLTEQEFGRLTVIERTKSYSTNDKHAYWKCLCECGNIVVVQGSRLTNGHTQSCGCLQRELTVKRSKKHGKSKENIYGVWRSMKSRCYNSHSPDYCRYGARGITVCDEWLGKHGAENFIEWAISTGFKCGLTLDRINVNGNYEPSNCRWVTMKEQQNNKRNNHLMTYNGKTQTMKQWSEETGIKYATLKQRISTYHWSTEKALTTPIQEHNTKTG